MNGGTHDRFVAIFGWLACAQTPVSAAQRLRTDEIAEFFAAFLDKQFVDAADAMPANKYSFAPSVGAFNGVRSFGHQVKHLAATNYIFAAGALGEQPPADAGDETGPDDLCMKCDIIAYLRSSFTALNRAAAAMDEENAIVGNVPIHR